uniref:Uncharacterized protein n=1 Tax=Hyaloperonospora arabidopsidis (strain Emoy2) TaxID=559515 RepID=M4C446_HYAAE
MALRDEHDFLSENERQFLANCLRQPPHIRADGRELLQHVRFGCSFVAARLRAKPKFSSVGLVLGHRHRRVVVLLLQSQLQSWRDLLSAAFAKAAPSIRKRLLWLRARKSGPLPATCTWWTTAAILWMLRLLQL